MFAEGKYLDVSYDNHLIMILIKHGSINNIFRQLPFQRKKVKKVAGNRNVPFMLSSYPFVKYSIA
jgi:hypothetical protein